MINNIFEEKSKDNMFIDENIIIQKIYIDIVINNSELIRLNDKNKIEEKIKNKLVQEYNILDNNIINKYINVIKNKMFGYDILQKYIDDEKVTDIRVVEYNQIYIKKKGKWIKVKENFKDLKELTDFIVCVVIKNGGKINYDNPLATVVDKKYNLRIEAGINPVNSKSPSLVIRIHRNSKKIDLQKLINYKMLNKKTEEKIMEYIKSGKNIVISGKGGSGKTTLLRAIINEIDDTTAISTNEESTELFIANKNVIQREIVTDRKTNNITLEKLTKQSLITSNDIIVIGELKGGEAIVFFDAIATGHIGYATVHSNNAYNTLNRLAMLAKRSATTSAIDINFIKTLFASSIDVIIHLQNFKIVNILEVKYNYLTDGYEYVKVYSKEKYDFN